MQIQLRQAEIVTALKQFIARQGINLEGKTVDIAFTATRKEGGGITADIQIEDIVIPFSDDAPIAAAAPAAEGLQLAQTAEVNQPTQTTEAAEAAVEEVAEEPASAPAPEQKKVASLFG